MELRVQRRTLLEAVPRTECPEDTAQLGLVYLDEWCEIPGMHPLWMVTQNVGDTRVDCDTEAVRDPALRTLCLGGQKVLGP